MKLLADNSYGYQIMDRCRHTVTKYLTDEKTLAEKELERCMRPEMRAELQRLRSNDSVDSFTADAVANFFPRTCCVKHKQHDKREPGLFKEEFRCTEMLCLCSKTYSCYDVTSNKFKYSSKGLNERFLERNGDGPLEKYRRVLNE